MADRNVRYPHQDNKPPDICRQIVDLVELHCHGIIVDRKNRADWADMLGYWTKRFTTYHFGCIYNRMELAGLMSDLCLFDENEEIQSEGYSTENLLFDLTSKDWEDYLNKFSEAKKSILRKDAHVLIIPHQTDGHKRISKEANEESIKKIVDDGLNEELSSASIFNKEYTELVTKFRLHQALSFLPEEIFGPGSPETSEEPWDDAICYINFVGKHFQEDEDLLTILKSVVVHRHSSESDIIDPRSWYLKPANQVMDILDRKEFSQLHFQKKLERLLMKWEKAALPIPLLAEIGYAGCIASVATARLSSANEMREEVERGGNVMETNDESSKRDIEFTHSSHKKSHAASSSKPEAGSFVEEQTSHFARRIIRRKPDNSPSNKKLTTSIEFSDDDSFLPYNLPTPKTNPRKASPSKRRAAHRMNFEKDNLKRARENLMEHVDDDPLEECVALARQAVPPTHAHDGKGTSPDTSRGRGHLLTKKTTARREEFYDSDAEASSDNPVELGDVPPAARVNSVLPPIRQSLSSASSYSKRKRKIFTVEEKAAIKSGVRRFGVGKWADIKEYYKETLKDRTQVNIKDCFRTMLKRGEIDG